MPQYQVTTNGRTYPVTAQALSDLDLVSAGPAEYHLLREGKSYHLHLLEVDRHRKRVRLRVNGRELELSLRDATDQLVDQLGFSRSETRKSKNILAPMPGLVLDILVEPGAEVTAGTPLIILEAMKMENVLKAEGDGTVTAISVDKGAAVDKRQLLIEIE